MMKTKSYRQLPHKERGLPTAATVLRYGGSCCGSAVCAAAALRPCGIPAQVTYCPPASYLHGIVRFYLDGYGWVRMDSIYGAGKLPLVQEERDLGLARLFDMPIEMEKIAYAYAWPYHHNDGEGKYYFLAGGRRVPSVRCAGARRVAKPFFHFEPGSWNTVLGSELCAGRWMQWGELVRDSSKAIIGK